MKIEGEADKTLWESSISATIEQKFFASNWDSYPQKQYPNINILERNFSRTFYTAQLQLTKFDNIRFFY